MKILKTATIAFLLSIIWTVPNVAFAHSALVSAVPDNTVDTEVSELKLTFNEEIEPLSKVEVTNEAGEEQTLSDIKVKGKVMTVTFETPLTNGVYTVNWKIISADGHPLEGSYAMEVKIVEPIPSPSSAASESPAARAPSPSQSNEMVDNSTPNPSEMPETPSPSAQASEEVDESKSNSNKFDVTTWIIIAGALLLVVAAASAILKKKKG
ncbi:copper resistance protein CopC [Cohnella sp. LGH]|uniref:copper resistance CopC family protein n=1 Tax=Cohnella sp. LGH TaxID=1619153 RepID=UPI001ADCF9A1|nr:copper resistance protein CopC [Cohnella sp. LGH]QTH45244.1 copper resistance protein CopC [Cohnella sp. LGH]